MTNFLFMGDSDMSKVKYKCQQCDGKATIQGTQAVDLYETPHIEEYVICEACGYTISKDAADCVELLAAIRDIAGLAQMQDVDDVAELHTALADIFDRAVNAIAKAEQTN